MSLSYTLPPLEQTLWNLNVGIYLEGEKFKEAIYLCILNLGEKYKFSPDKYKF